MKDVQSGNLLLVRPADFESGCTMWNTVMCLLLRVCDRKENEGFSLWCCNAVLLPGSRIPVLAEWTLLGFWSAAERRCLEARMSRGAVSALASLQLPGRNRVPFSFLQFFSTWPVGKVSTMQC